MEVTAAYSRVLLLSRLYMAATSPRHPIRKTAITGRAAAVLQGSSTIAEIEITSSG
jgi:hypothetical protein